MAFVLPVSRPGAARLSWPVGGPGGRPPDRGEDLNYRFVMCIVAISAFSFAAVTDLDRFRPKMALFLAARPAPEGGRSAPEGGAPAARPSALP
jgi:hypothetical protein